MAIDVSPGQPLRHIATFNNSGSWLAPENTNVAFVSIHGASGGGGGRNNDNSVQAGAGGAGTISGAWVQVNGGSNHIVVVGAAGAAGNSQAPAGNAGTAGGTSIFDGAITVTGGNGGNQAVGSGQGSSGNRGTASGVTSLTTLNPGNTAIVRTSGFTNQNTGAAAGGNAAGPSNSAVGAGTAGIVHIYV